jgi:hypothetical protein
MDQAKEKNIIITATDQVNSENVLDDEVFDYLFSIEDWQIRQEEKLKIGDIAKKARKKGEFLKFYKAYEEEWAAKFKSKQATGKTQFFDDEPDKELNCGPWIANSSGVKRVEVSKGGVQEMNACPVPVTINRFFENRQTAEEKVELAFKKNGKWKTITPAKSTIASANKIVSLADVGLPVTSESARLLVQFLADLEAYNPGKIVYQPSTSKLGWMKVKDKLKFVPYSMDGISFDAEERFKKTFDAIKPHGDKEKWLSLVRGIRASYRIEPRVMLAASFASALIGPLNLLPFVVHLYGRTEGGKTVCAMLATSVWANPDRGASYFADFMTTQVALEARADLLNNMPLVIDDTAKVSKKIGDDFSELIYILCSGTGKDRSNVNLGLRRTNTWENCILTTGEHPILDVSAQGGAINRVISVEAGHTRIFRDGHAVAECLKENYGFAGEFFTEYLSLKGFDWCKRRYEEIFAELKSGKMEKQAMAMSAILLADEIATSCLFADGKALIIDDVKDCVRSENDISEELRCYQYVCEQVMVNNANFYDDDAEFKSPHVVWGRINNDVVYFIPTILKQITKDARFSLDGFVKWGIRKGVIQHQRDRQTYKARLFPNEIDPKQKVCYAIEIATPNALKVLGEDNDDDLPDEIKF